MSALIRPVVWLVEATVLSLFPDVEDYEVNDLVLEAVIHPGMPKTGTSSIQETLASTAPEGWQAIKASNHNMSGSMRLVFESASPSSHFAVARGFDQAKLDNLYQKRVKELADQVDLAFKTGKNVIFSAERVCGAPEEAIDALADYFRAKGFRPRIIGYVRKPVSYMQSFFQQQLKIKDFSLENAGGLWPRYRSRFEKLDRIFGPENVTLKVFDADTLKDGNVVLDFFSELGAELDSEPVSKLNESLTVEACAMLYVQRKFGKGFIKGFPSANAKNLDFIKTLSGINGHKLHLMRSLCAPVVDKFSDDLDWMENRLNVPLLDLPEEGPDYAVGSDQDLIEVALQNIGVLEGLISERLEKESDQPEKMLIHKLELLRKLHY